MPGPATPDEYIAGFDADIAERLGRIRTTIVAAVSHAFGSSPEEKIRYGMPAVMLDGRYALHYAAWRKHIGLYPVPRFDDPLEARVAPYRSEKDSVVFPHSREVPYDLVRAIAEDVAHQRAAAAD
ncbi:iron chaperone [Microbacterium sp. NPDC057407]|uniref:iron chaperone n=1 Tax=Microbacterium sp. NPDC057407 TaxID=3346120 RepID=UPI00366B9A16